jgi:predicted nucleotidyltransferase
MARTALDLTAEELLSYQPGRNFDREQMTQQRWEQAWQLARTLAHLLRERFGATRVVAFGSLVRREWFSPWSDIDLAAWGISANQFYQAVASVTDISQDFQVDLVDPEDCRLAVRQSIEDEGIDL